MIYNHTQKGKLIIIILLALIVYFGFIMYQEGYDQMLIITMLVVIFIVGSLSTLNVVIDGEYLRLKFGYGLFKKKFKLIEIASATAAKHSWYYGWGIRYNLALKMWTFNVSGFDVIEIIMKNDKRYRIGTDEPKKLEQAISQMIK